MENIPEAKVWHLRKGDLELAAITITALDFPWLYGTVERGAHFDVVKPYFDLDAQVLKRLDDGNESGDDYAAIDRIYEQLKADGVQLFAPEGEPVAEFLMHIVEGDAWFRYSDEPFDEE